MLGFLECSLTKKQIWSVGFAGIDMGLMATLSIPPHDSHVHSSHLVKPQIPFDCHDFAVHTHSASHTNHPAGCDGVGESFGRRNRKSDISPQLTEMERWPPLHPQRLLPTRRTTNLDPLSRIADHALFDFVSEGNVHKALYLTHRNHCPDSFPDGSL